MDSKENNAGAQAPEEQFSISDFISRCISNWKWFVITILLFIGLGAAYLLRSQPRYEREMELLVKDQEGGSAASDIASSFSSLGLVSSNTNVYNELISFRSPAVMYEVVKKLGLDVNYTLKGFPRGKTLYGSDLPWIVTFPDLDIQQSGSFKMDLDPDGSGRLYKFVAYTAEGKVKYDKEIALKPGFTTVRTPLGRVEFTPNPRYEKPKIVLEPDKSRTYFIGKQAMQNAVEHYSEMLKGVLADKDAEIIDLSIKDVSVERAVDILNTILEVYNRNYVEDKNKLAIATSAFIDERLAVIQQELGTVDSEISDYQSKTLMPDYREAGKINLQGTQDLSIQELETTNMLAMARYVRDYVNNPNNADKVIPVNTGVENPTIEAEISAYNTLLVLRNNLVANSSASNPVVQQYDAQLKGKRESIVKALDTQAMSLASALKNTQGARGQLRDQLAAAPSKARHLLGAQRQQAVKESLYLFLLQKREENELTQTFTANNIRVITPPMGPLEPVSPRNNLILCICFLLGFILPAAVIYIKMLSDNKVRSRKDLQQMTVPFIGEIPFFGRKRPFQKITNAISSKSKKKKRVLEKVEASVTAGNRDMLNESFRVVRGSLEFMMKQHNDENIIMLTSFNPGSGKSFISYNLAASFAIKGKKIVVVDCDLRHGSQSQFVGMPGRGLSNYLTGATDDWRKLLVAAPGVEGMYVMPIGHRPPNPAELLDNGRIGTLLREMSEEFDYVLLDCPPVDIVVDTQIVEKYVHRTVFVVRAGLLLKSAIPEIDVLYDSQRFKRMGIILNGTETQLSRYGAYGSSYYGNHYDSDKE